MVNAQLVHEAFGEYGQPRLHVGMTLGGLRPIMGYCSRSSTAPFTRAASSERKYTAADATSSGEKRRPPGAYAVGSREGQSSGSPSVAFNTRSLGVSVQPGLIWLTRMPSGPWASARLRVRVISAPLQAE